MDNIQFIIDMANPKLSAPIPQEDSVKHEFKKRGLI